MRVRTAVIGMFTLASLAGCGGYGGTGMYGGGGGGGGPVGSVTAGPGIQFVSGHNGSSNTAVDTIAAGGTVTWSWTGSLPHSVQSVGSPELREQRYHDRERDVYGNVPYGRHVSVRLRRPRPADGGHDRGGVIAEGATHRLVRWLLPLVR